MAEEKKICVDCPLHQNLPYRVGELEKNVSDMGSIRLELAVLRQKFDNIRYPIWIIFGAVLVKIAEAVISFAPVIKTASSVSLISP